MNTHFVYYYTVLTVFISYAIVSLFPTVTYCREIVWFTDSANAASPADLRSGRLNPTCFLTCITATLYLSPSYSRYILIPSSRIF